MTSDAGVPVILIGNGRSGTSILAQLMREHFGVAFGTESQFIVSFYRKLDSYGSLESDENLRRLIRHLLQERWFQRSHKFNGFSLNEENVFQAVQKRDYAGVLDAIFSLFAAHLQMSRWGDKTPSYIKHLDIIYELFPNAKYVHLVRDGRDVALSLTKIYFGPKNIYTAANRWKDTVEKGDRFASSLDAGQVLTLRYEDMLSNPMKFFDRLLLFLEVEGDRDRIADNLRENVIGTLKADNSYKWKKELSARQIKAFERIAGTQLRRHGYETLTDQESREGTKLQTLFWRGHDEIAKWRFPRYWSDNAYKAKLAALNVLRRFS